MSGSVELGSEVGFSASRRVGPRALREPRPQRGLRARIERGGRRVRAVPQGCPLRIDRRGSAGCEPEKKRRITRLNRE